MKIRVVKTASKARAVQVVRYQNNKRIILRHIGSAHTDAELEELMRIGHEWMKNYSDQLSIFPDENPNKLLHINHCTFIGVQYRYFYQQIRAVQDKVGFDGLPPVVERFGWHKNIRAGLQTSFIGAVGTVFRHQSQP
jgi:hypothetical protein